MWILLSDARLVLVGEMAVKASMAAAAQRAAIDSLVITFMIKLMLPLACFLSINSTDVVVFELALARRSTGLRCRRISFRFHAEVKLDTKEEQQLAATRMSQSSND